MTYLLHVAFIAERPTFSLLLISARETLREVIHAIFTQ